MKLKSENSEKESNRKIPNLLMAAVCTSWDFMCLELFAAIATHSCKALYSS